MLTLGSRYSGSFKYVDSETWTPPKESWGIVDPAEIVEILSVLHDMSDIEGGINLQRVARIYFLKDSRLYHTIEYTGADERRAALLVDVDIYKMRRWCFDNFLCMLVLTMITFGIMMFI
jgi:hypothetical protein